MDLLEIEATNCCFRSGGETFDEQPATVRAHIVAPKFVIAGMARSK